MCPNCVCCRCAGLIAAVPNNTVCAVGVALGASVSGIRMLDGKVTDSLEAQSFIYKAHLNWIYSCSWGPEDNGRTIEGPGKLAQVSTCCNHSCECCWAGANGNVTCNLLMC